ncbi:cobalamin biosynthesis protein CbiD [Iocasia frigidifontis]|uniref:Cobalt-precorrin-5B C(1)-methyltransferase n=1 Tax=Iocasia fonsfrigidae TaxID=2682810 RepID=A0A8A7KH02_9FIRM|nr:cobalt-precorrin-5B (C(1))-methyltransferase CbiD [Iocasia fonsfrigidae]QTL98789.1 cobalamin biosynthesis protein CbiD [Iocasia fonsfrigidae]
MVFESYVTINGKRYRRGFTTGSAAAAAAKGAALILFTGQEPEQVQIKTPAGIELNIPLKAVEYGEGFVRVFVEKDAGDDPDLTDGMEIAARVEEISTGIELSGGQGVGRVTKPGLSVPVGKAAINPVPEKMIKEAVSSVLPEGSGAKVMIEVPGGEEVAQKTFNPRLGIVGGISILGTSGIVEPMSKKAYQESLALELKQLVVEGGDQVVLVFGNYGREMAVKLGYQPKEVVRMSNFAGYMLRECQRLKIKRVIILGHLGKIVKLAGGIFNTHSKVADARLEIIAAYTAALGGDRETICCILSSNTSAEAVGIIIEAGLVAVFDLLAERVVIRIKEYLREEGMGLKSIIFTLEEGVLGTYDQRGK